MEEKPVQPAKSVQPPQYSDEELTELRKFIKVVKDNEHRAALACWGNHSKYTDGY